MQQPNIHVTTNAPYMPVNYDASSHHNASASGHSGASTGGYSAVTVGSDNRRKQGGAFKYILGFFALLFAIGLIWSIYAVKSAGQASSVKTANVSVHPEDSSSVNTAEPSTQSPREPSGGATQSAGTRADQVNTFNEKLHEALEAHRYDKDLNVLRQYYDFPMDRWYGWSDVSPKKLSTDVWKSGARSGYGPAVFIKTCSKNGDVLVTMNAVPHVGHAVRAGDPRTLVTWVGWGTPAPHIKSVYSGRC